MLDKFEEAAAKARRDGNHTLADRLYAQIADCLATDDTRDLAAEAADHKQRKRAEMEER